VAAIDFKVVMIYINDIQKSHMWRKRTFSELSAETQNRKGILPVTVLLHNIRSQYNVGAIMRTADAVGIEQVICSGYTPIPDQSGVQKTALKSLETLQWLQVSDPVQCVQDFRSRGYRICGLEQCHGSQLFHQVEYHFPMLLVVGEEVQGIEDALLALCDQMIEIPMFGSAHSLNVSVASSVVLYHLLSQWQKI
jgi:23S rRNA (guanosine2251-2'-O)-methyltransferase